MKRTVLEVRAILGGREVHLDVIEGFALAEIVVIGGGEQTRAVATDDGLQVTAVDVEGEGFESVHFGSDLVLVEDHDQGEEGKRMQRGRRRDRSTSFRENLYREEEKEEQKCLVAWLSTIIIIGKAYCIFRVSFIHFFYFYL